jgi:hypothetical protein
MEESALSQRATTSGNKMRQSLENVGEGIQNAAEGVINLGPQKTAVEAGGQAKKLIGENVQEMIAPAKKTYEKLAGETPFVDIAQESSKRVSKNIRDLPFAKIQGSKPAAFAEQIAGNLENVKTLDELRNLRSYVGKSLSDPYADPALKATASEVYARLSRMEQNAITRNAIAAVPKNMRATGNTLAKGMITEIKEANKLYAGVSKKLQSLADKTGLGRVNTYADFINRVNDVPNEQLMRTFFQSGDVSAVNEFRQMFPQAFEELRKTKVNELYVGSVMKGGDISIPKLISQVRKMGPEYRKLLFGDAAEQRLKDIETVWSATHKRVGPSGTPEGISYLEFNPLNPATWFNEMYDASRLYILQGGPMAKKAAKYVKSGDLMRATEPKLKSTAKGLIGSRLGITEPVKGLIGGEDE